MKFQGHTGQNITDLDLNWAFLDYRPVAAFKSLRFALLAVIKQLDDWFSPSVCLSVCLSVCDTFLTMFPLSYHHEIFRSCYQ